MVLVCVFEVSLVREKVFTVFVYYVSGGLVCVARSGGGLICVGVFVKSPFFAFRLKC